MRKISFKNTEEKILRTLKIVGQKKLKKSLKVNLLKTPQKNFLRILRICSISVTNVTRALNYCN